MPNHIYKILHVDDDNNQLKFTKIFLEKDKKLNVTSIDSPVKALEIIPNSNYECIITDYKMPEMDGITFAKKALELCDLPIIIYTGQGSEEVAQAAFAAGISDYFRKEMDPSHYQVLEKRIQHVVEQARAEKSLKASEERFRAIFEGASDGILVADPETKQFMFANPKMSELTGYSSNEFTKLGVADLHPKKDLPHVIDEFEKQLKGESTLAVDLPVLKKDGQVIYCDVNSRPITIENRGVMAGFFRDTTERRQSGEVLRRSEEKYRQLVESSTEGVFTIDLSAKVDWANGYGMKLIGYSESDLPVSLLKLIPAKYLLKTMKMFSDGLMGKVVTEPFDLEVYTKSRELIPVSYKGTLLHDEKGKVTGILGIIRDRQERNKLEKLPVDSQERFQDLIETTGEFIWEMDPQCRYVYCSPQGENIWGLKPEDMIGKTFFEVMPPSDREKALEYFGAMGDSPKNFSGLQTTGYDGQGRLIFVETNGVPFFDDQGVFLGFRGISRDITERKKVEEALRESQNLLVKSGRIGKVGGWQFDIDTLKQTWTDETYRIHEVDLNFRPTVENGIGFYTPESRAIIEQAVQQAIAHGKPFDVELQITTAKGNIRSVRAIGEANLANRVVYGFFQDVTERKKAEEELILKNLVFDEGIAANSIADVNGVITEANDTFLRFWGYPAKDEVVGKPLPYFFVDSKEAAAILTALIGMGKWEGDFSAKRRDGSVFMAHGLATTLRSKYGEILGYQSSVLDVTQQRKAEEKLNQTMNQLGLVNEKLGIVGSLTRHDVRNKLSVVTNYSFLLKTKHADQADIMDGLSKMEHAIEDSMKIFEFARKYEKLGVEELTNVDAEKTINEASALFPSLNFKVVNDCHGLSLLADSFLIQLFYNFIDNTRKYGEKTTAIRVYFEKANSDDLRLIYEDDGVGISAENKLKLFTEGFSTGCSTGFGLFLSKKMMDIYGWQIQESGEPGNGVKFILTIPKVNQYGRECFQIAQ